MLVNSEARAARVRHLLHPALADFVREPLSSASRPNRRWQAGMAGAPAPHGAPEGVDPAELRAAVHQVLDRQYGKTIGEPVPVLSGKTPRQAVRSAKGRQAVEKWLKGLEQASARCPPGDPVRDYDFSWMWRELGVAHLRT